MSLGKPFPASCYLPGLKLRPNVEVNCCLLCCLFLYSGKFQTLYSGTLLPIPIAAHASRKCDAFGKKLPKTASFSDSPIHLQMSAVWRSFANVAGVCSKGWWLLQRPWTVTFFSACVFLRCLHLLVYTIPKGIAVSFLCALLFVSTSHASGPKLSASTNAANTVRACFQTRCD